MFRIVGDIKIDTSVSVEDKQLLLNVNENNEPFAFFQSQKPLTEDNPYFFVRINYLKKNSNVTIGIASSDINDTVNPGSWNNTIGYESLSGKCISSHRVNANTLGRAVEEDDSFGMLVTNFGTSQSTVLFFHNREPVATRYHFEKDYSKFLPTITFENGPIEVEVFLPEIIEFDSIPLNNQRSDVVFIRPPFENCLYDEDMVYVNVQRTEDMPLQSPIPLSKKYPFYECLQLDVSEKGQGSSVGIASCSPLKPTPTCDLLRDYYTWLPKMNLKVGNSIGWGIFYNPETPNMNDKAEQLALVYVTLDDAIVDVLFVLQPEGGFFPLVLMQPWATRTKIQMKKTTNQAYTNKLKKLFYYKLQIALEVYNKDLAETAIYKNDIITDCNAAVMKIDGPKTSIRIPEDNPGVHYFHYNRPLTPERRFFFIEILKIGAKSNVVIGVGEPSFFVNNVKEVKKLPGEISKTIGYHSMTGQMLYNGKSHGNMMGHSCKRGDSMGLEMEVFEEKMSVAIFSKNFKPVGTRFLTLEDHGSFLASLSVLSCGEEIEINVYWHTVVSMPPHFNVRNPEDWCVPEGTKIDTREKIFTLPHHLDHSLCIQAPYSLHHKYNHFEIVLMDDFSKENPPPAIALCTASPLDPPPMSLFKQDYLRFWPTGEAMQAVKKNDRVGWGIFYVDENLCKEEEQLIICFLTINRRIVYLRVLHQPPGGFYPVIIAPPNVYRIKIDTMGARVNTEDLNNEQLKRLVMIANKEIQIEKKMISEGKF